MHSGVGYDFVAGPSGLVVPSTADITHDGKPVKQVAFELVGPANTSKYLRGDNPPTWVAPQIDTIGAGTDITTNNVSTGKHGLTPKLPNDATKYLDGTGAYTVPPAGSPTGAAGGDIAGTGSSTYPNPTLTAIITAGGPVGSATTVPVITYDAKGRITAVSSATITPSPGSGGALTLISDTLLVSDTANFDLTSIPGTYTQLLLMLWIRSAAAAVTSDTINLRFNNLSTGIYYFQRIEASATAVSGAESLAATAGRVMRATAATSTANRYSSTTVTIPNYANTTDHKNWLSGGFWPTGTGTGTLEDFISGGVCADTGAVSRITILSATGANLKAGSRATLYGMA